MSIDKASQVPDNAEELSDEARRKLLIKVGRLSAYVVPASIALLLTTDASAGIGSGGGQKCYPLTLGLDIELGEVVVEDVTGDALELAADGAKGDCWVAGWRECATRL